MNFYLSISKQGDKYLVSTGAEGAYEASAKSPLLAIRKWIHYIGAGVVKCRSKEISLQRFAERAGISEEDAMELAQVETLVPEATMASVVKFDVDAKTVLGLNKLLDQTDSL